MLIDLLIRLHSKTNTLILYLNEQVLRMRDDHVLGQDVSLVLGDEIINHLYINV